MYVPQKPLDRLSRNAGKPMLFIHTPKCGGRFVATAFGRRFKSCISLRHPDMRGHLTWGQYCDAFAKNGLSLDEFALFSVARNPWQWHLSWYHYVHADIGGKHSGMPDEHELFSRFSFLDYLKWLDEPLITGKPNQYYLRQVSDWIVDENGAIVVPDILRQETLRKDFERLADKHGLLINIPRGRRNQSFWGDYRSEYCDEGVEIGTRRHARDISLFGYAFEHPDTNTNGSLIAR